MTGLYKGCRIVDGTVPERTIGYIDLDVVEGWFPFEARARFCAFWPQVAIAALLAYMEARRGSPDGPMAVAP